MTTTDQLLTKLVNLTEPTVELFLPKRDAKVLRSLASIISSPAFITENQSRLLLRILQENKEKIPVFQEEILNSISNPTWSKYFRKIDTIRKLEIGVDAQGDQCILINFTFSSQIRKVITDLSRNMTGLIALHNGKLYSADLTEQNIVTLVEGLSSFNFTISDKIDDFYKIIKSWEKTEVKNQFALENMTNLNFQTHITNDLGIDTPLSNVVIKDRSVRYQYIVNTPPKKPENLTEKIAFRQNSKIWINSNEIALDEIFKSLIELKRLPVLVVFNASDPSTCLRSLEKIDEILEKNEIFDNVGIYFRLDNSGAGTDFNKIISSKQYNCQLDHTTKIVGIAGGKIPKFLLKTNWKPMSVVSLGKLTQNTKTSVYANTCDLIINWSETEPLVDARLQWE